MLVLLSQVVLGLSAGMLELMPASVGVGTAVSMVLGGVLMLRQTLTRACPGSPDSRLNPHSESK